MIARQTPMRAQRGRGGLGRHASWGVLWSDAQTPWSSRPCSVTVHAVPSLFDVHAA
jgi:hypothetical protein